MSVLATLAVLMGCSGTNKATPPPTGGFSDTNLSGTYVFSTSGADVDGDFLTMVGTFTACGCVGGTISAGSVVMNDPALGLVAPVPPLTITGGSYTVGVDGRGTATLTTNPASAFGTPTIVLDFVLTSSQGGLVTEFDNNGSGSGTLDLQSSVTQAQLAAGTGTFVFNLAGVSSSLGAPEATAGSVTLDASGNATGVQDINSDAASNPPTAPLSITSPSTVLVGTSPGTATLVTSSGTLSFAVYAISATHLKFIETDVAPVLAGDVFSQSANTFPSGPLAFTMAGLDLNPANEGPLVVGGMMNSSGTAISAGVEDYNDNFIPNITSSSPITPPLAFTGQVAPTAGRFLLTLNTFENGADGAAGTFTFAAYPSTGGTQLLEVDGAGITGGVAYPQGSTSFASGQGYGLNLTGTNGAEVDDIAEFTYSTTNTSTPLSGLIDVNNGAPTLPQNFSGSYAADTTNLGRGLITTITGGVNLVSYTVDSTNSIFIEIDPYQVALGSIGQQASESQGAIATRMASLRPRAAARAAWKKKPTAVGQGR
jgi:hypothetical protein